VAEAPASDADWWDAVFRPEPDTWGLRGDPHAWHELNEALRQQPKPDDETSMRTAIVEALEGLLGSSLSAGEESVLVPRYASGGMSSGHVHVDTWRRRLIPLLVSRGAFRA